MMNLIWPRLLLMLLISIVVLIAMTAAVFKSRETRAWIIGSAAVAVSIVILIVTLTAIFSTRQHVDMQTTKTTQASQQVNNALPPGDGGQAWHTTVDQQFTADIYPSSKSAIRSIGTHLYSYLNDFAGDDGVVQVTFACSDQSDCHEVISRLVKINEQSNHFRYTYNDIQGGFIQFSRKQHPSVFGGRLPEDEITGKVAVSVTVNRDTVNESNVSDQKTVASGKVITNIAGLGRAYQLAIVWVDKPWVDDMSMFVNTQPGDSWIRVLSSRFATSSTEAQQFADQQAGIDLVSFFRFVTLRHNPPTSPPNWSDQQLAEWITAQLPESGMVVDRFTQKLSRPYGDVWRQAILINTSNDHIKLMARKLAQANLTQLAQAKAEVQGQRVQTVVKSFAWLSVLGMAGLIFIIYLFLNAATRGYYTVAMRIATVVLIAVLAAIAYTLLR